MRFSGSGDQDISRWINKGLIDAAKGMELRHELASIEKGFGLGSILAILGALLLGAAILTLIAANWEDFSRIGRVAFVFGVIILGYFVGAWREKTGDLVFAQVFYLLGAVAFGGGIALIGQMYHLSGDAALAALVWALATLIGAILLRSFALSALAGTLGLFYVYSAISEPSWHSDAYLWIAPLFAVALGLVSRWNISRSGMHSAAGLLLVTLILYRFSIDFDDSVTLIDMVLAFGGAGLFFALSYYENIVERITGFARPLIQYMLALSFFGFAIIQVQLADRMLSVALYGLIVIALSIGALMFNGKNHRGVRGLAYSAFGIEVLYLASVTIGSLLGTSVFFLSSGLIVLILAYVVVRIEKRLNATPNAASEEIVS